MPVSDQATPAIALPVHPVKRTHLNKEKQNPQERLLAACMHYGESCLHAAGTIVNVWPVVHTDTSSGLISTAPHLLSAAPNAVAHRLGRGNKPRIPC